MNTNTKHHQKEMEVHEDRLAGEEKFTNPVYSSSQLTSPHGPTPPRSEVRGSTVSASPKKFYTPLSSLVVFGWGGAVRRDEHEGEERGKSEPFSFSKTQHFTFVVKPHPKVLKICLVFKRNHEDIEFSIKMKMVKGANHLVHRMEGG